MIVDFFGLPGSGKSVLSHLVAEQLKKVGYTVNEVSYNMDHYHGKKIRTLLKVKYTILLLVYYPQIFFHLFITIIRKRQSLLSVNFYSYLFNIGYKVYEVKHNETADIIIFDEGFCQSVLSLCYKKKDIFSIEILNTIESLLGKNVNIEYIFVKTDFHTIKQRLVNRHDGNSRFERLEENDMKRMFDEQMQLCMLLPYSQLIENNEGQNLFNISKDLSMEIKYRTEDLRRSDVII